MAGFDEIRQVINNNIYENQDGDITGVVMNEVLNDIVDAMEDGNLIRAFKGWWPDLATLKAAITAEPGDSAYVKDASPATTWSIYVYDATASSNNYWADSGTNADTSNVQTFETSEQVNQVAIINDLITGGEHDVLSAEQGKVVGNALIHCFSDIMDFSASEFQNGTSSYASNAKRLILNKEKLIAVSGRIVRIVVPYSFVSGGNVDRVTIPLYNSNGTVIQNLDFGWTYFTANNDFDFTIDLSLSTYSNVRYVGIYFGSDVNITPSDLGGTCTVYIRKATSTKAVDTSLLARRLVFYDKKVIINDVNSNINAGFHTNTQGRFHFIYQVQRCRLHIRITNPTTSTFRFSFKFFKQNNINLGLSGPYWGDTGWITDGIADYVCDNNNCDYLCLTLSKKDNSNFTKQNAIDELATMTLLVEYADEHTVPMYMPGVKKIAHRGTFHEGLPENSVPAFLLAKQLGYDYIECDVRVTSDGNYVIMHDESINRTCNTANGYGTISGTVNVADTTLADLRSNYVLACDDPTYRTPIPTLQEYLIACKGSRSIAMIEIEPMTDAQIQGVYDLCVDILGHGNFVFNAGGYARLDYIRSIDDNVDLFYETTGIIDTVSTVDGSSRNHPHNWWYAEYGGTYGALNAAAVKSYHAKGMRVASWTVPSTAMESLVDIGVDAIATNDIPANTSGCVSVAEKFGYDNDKAVYTNGTISNNIITLSSGQLCKLPMHNSTKGVKCLRFKAQGNYTVTTNTKTYANSTTMNTSNFTKTYNDASPTTHELQLLYQSKVPYGTSAVTSQPSILITAVGSTEIYELDIYNMEV